MRSSILNSLFDIAFNSGLVRLDRAIGLSSLTVINYHRIGDPSAPGFDTFKPNISADQAMFAKQMDYLKRWFVVVSMQDVVRWLNHEADLPRNAALITFDDGYLDNYTQAFPVLRHFNFPAVIFLTTGYINSDRSFYWDLAAYSFFHTRIGRVTFHNGEERGWSNITQRDEVCKAWIESLKSLPEELKQTWVNQLPQQLEVEIPDGSFKNIMMNWDHVREMHSQGIEFGGHTVNHPILSRVSLEIAQTEIVDSREHIEKELGQPVTSFAYPNGMSADLHAKIEKMVAQAGYQTAFTLKNGPSLLSEVRQNPFAIRRIFISHRHNLPRFATQVSWFNRLRRE